jgi:hypothetical protein
VAGPGGGAGQPGGGTQGAAGGGRREGRKKLILCGPHSFQFGFEVSVPRRAFLTHKQRIQAGLNSPMRFQKWEEGGSARVALMELP